MRLATLVLVLLGLSGCDSFGIDADAPLDEAPASEPWTEMLDAVNAARAEGRTCGGTRYDPAPPLVWNGRLQSAATRHTADMVSHNHFDHTGTDGSGPGERASQAGYSWRVVGENIARGQPDVQEVMSDWLASAGHCRNLMDPRYAEMGASERSEYWTQLFALPR